MCHKLKFRKIRLLASLCMSAVIGLALLGTSDAQAQCQGSIAAGALISGGQNIKVHIGDILTISNVAVADQTAIVATTNGDLYITLPDGTTNHVGTDISLAAAPGACGGPSPIASFENPIGQFNANSSGIRLSYPMTVLVRAEDINRPLFMPLSKPGFSGVFNNVGGNPKEIQEIVGAIAQAVNGVTPSSAPIIPRTVIFPCTSITKTCNIHCTTIGDPIGFHGAVRNTGDAPLTGVTVVDNPPAT